MKKLLVLMLLLSVTIGLTACGCNHSETYIEGFISSTCTEDGYTGDRVCLSCKKTIEKGTVIKSEGHIPSSTMNAYDASCYSEGYTGDVVCRICGEIIVKGEIIPRKDHVAGDLCYAWEPTCDSDGYTGDIYCSVCYELLQEGETIPALGHTLEEPQNVVPSTCTSDGYSGDSTCTVCGEVIKGEVIPKLSHTYENNACTVCGWPVSGLYIDDKLQLDWESLVDAGYITMDKGTITGTLNTLYGKLVIDESVTAIKNAAFKNANLEVVYVPCTVSVLRKSTFEDCAELKSVFMYANSITLEDNVFARCSLLENVFYAGDIVSLGSSCFADCKNLKAFTVSEGVTYIPRCCFSGCCQLESVKLPTTLKEIGDEAFSGVPAEEIVLPEGLEKIGTNVFNVSGLKELILPSTVYSMGPFTPWQENGKTVAIENVDLSTSAIKNLCRDAFNGCSNLKELKLPKGLETIEPYALEDCFQLTQLVLPDTLYYIGPQNFDWIFREGIAGEEERDWYMVKDNAENLYQDGEKKGLLKDGLRAFEITSVVWPVTLIDGSVFTELPNLKNIFYRGSELQWSLTTSKDLFSEVTIYYDCEID